MNPSILPAQSSSLLPLPPQPRLDILPTELLQEIIDNLASIPRSSLEYDDRQRSLLSLCLTSKRLLSFAQPALFKAIIIDSREQAVQILRRSDLLVHCRSIKTCVGTTDFSRMEELGREFETIFARATSLDELSCLVALRQPKAQTTADITKLHLSSILLNPTIGLSFPHLTELSLWCIWPSSSLLNQETLRHLPSLRHFATDYLLDGIQSSDILSRLDTVSISIEDWKEMQEWVGRRRIGTAAILYRCDLSDFSRFQEASNVENLQLKSRATHTAWKEEHEFIESWQQLLVTAQPPYPLKSIYLPFLHLHHNGLPSPFPQHVQDAISGLIYTCERLNIEVILEEPLRDPTFESLISPDFVRRSNIRKVAVQRR